MSSGHEGKVAVVTGAARGIGRAIALRLARAGADVAIVDIDLDGAKAWNEQLTAATVPAEIEAIGRRSIGVQADLTNRDAARDALKQVEDALGPIDILVNAAGGMLTPYDKSFASGEAEADMQRMFAINYFATVHCCQAVIPSMRDRGEGVIVNISSQGGTQGAFDGSGAQYAASKAALTNFTRSLAGELGPSGIRVNAAAPGYTMSSRAAAMAASRGVGDEGKSKFALRRFGEPDDIAKVVEFLSGDLAGFVTGQCIAVNGGATLFAS